MVVTAKVGALAVAALLMAGAGVGVALTRDDDPEQVAAPVEETTTSTPTTMGPTTTTVTPTSAPTTTGVPPTTTIRRTTTTARPTTTTTKPSTSTAGTTCTPAQLEAKLTTSRPYYTAGQPMEFTTTLRNKTAAPCAHGGWAVQVLFKDDAGRTFPGVGVSASTLPGDTLTPGAVLTHSGAWDHRACPEPACGPLPSGPAYVQVTWYLEGYVYDLTQSFILT